MKNMRFRDMLAVFTVGAALTVMVLSLMGVKNIDNSTVSMLVGAVVNAVSNMAMLVLNAYYKNLNSDRRHDDDVGRRAT